MWDDSGLDKELLSYPVHLLDLYRGERLLHVLDRYRLNARLITMIDATPPPQTFSSPTRPSPLSPVIIPPSSPVLVSPADDKRPPLALFLSPPPGFSPTPSPLPRQSPTPPPIATLDISPSSSSPPTRRAVQSASVDAPATSRPAPTELQREISLYDADLALEKERDRQALDALFAQNQQLVRLSRPVTAAPADITRSQQAARASTSRLKKDTKPSTGVVRSRKRKRRSITPGFPPPNYSVRRSSAFPATALLTTCPLFRFLVLSVRRRTLLVYLSIAFALGRPSRAGNTPRVWPAKIPRKGVPGVTLFLSRMNTQRGDTPRRYHAHDPKTDDVLFAPHPTIQSQNQPLRTSSNHLATPPHFLFPALKPHLVLFPLPIPFASPPANDLRSHLFLTSRRPPSSLLR